jgi:hypothetical protein
VLGRDACKGSPIKIRTGFFVVYFDPGSLGEEINS